MSTTSTPAFLSLAEAALVIGVSAPTIRAWCRSGRLPSARPGGPAGSLRIPEQALRDLAEGQDR
jgi:excisionase family DNA binding protein